MNLQRIRQFRMKRGNQLIFLLRCYNFPIDPSQYSCAAPYVCNIWSTDKGHWNRSDAAHFTIGIKTSQLSSIGIPLSPYLHGSQMTASILYLLCRKNQPVKRSVQILFLTDFKMLRDYIQLQISAEL